MAARVLLFVAFTLFFVNCPAFTTELPLPGHSLSTKEASARADSIFTGQLVSLDSVNAKASRGQFIGKVVYLARAANGMHPPIATENGTVMTPPFVTDLGIPVSMTVGDGEVAPQVGRSYVFYAKDSTASGTRGLVALKLIPTGSNGIPSGGLFR